MQSHSASLYSRAKDNTTLEISLAEDSLLEITGSGSLIRSALSGRRQVLPCVPDVIAWVLDLHLKRRRRTLYTVLVANATDGALYAQCNAMIYEHNLFRTNLASKWQYVRYLKEQACAYLTVHFQPKGLLVCVC